MTFWQTIVRLTAISVLAHAFLAEKYLWQEVCSVVCQTQVENKIKNKYKYLN